MIDYHAFWQGLLLLFGVVPAAIGAAAGAVWAWRRQWRGMKLIAASLAGGVGFALLAFAGVTLLLRA